MGNCNSSNSKKDETICNLCYDKLNDKYMLCEYCHNRFHYHCLMKYSPALSTCILCNSKKIRSICISRDSFDHF